MATGASDFEGSFGGLLAVDFAEVDGILCGFAAHQLRINLSGSEGFWRINEIDSLGKRFDGVNGDAIDDSGLVGIGSGNSEGVEAGFASRKRGGKGATLKSFMRAEPTSTSTSTG